MRAAAIRFAVGMLATAVIVLVIGCERDTDEPVQPQPAPVARPAATLTPGPKVLRSPPNTPVPAVLPTRLPAAAKATAQALPIEPTGTPTPTSLSTTHAGPTETPTPTAIVLSTPTPSVVESPVTPVPVAAVMETPTPAPLPAEPCVQSPDVCDERDVSEVNPLLVGAGALVSQHFFGRPSRSVEDLLQSGPLETSPAHVAFRGTATVGSIRCAAIPIGRTVQQREESIRFLLGIHEDEPLPPAALIESEYSELADYPPTALMSWDVLDVARGGLSGVYRLLACFADYRVQEYLLGSGPGTVTVAYDIVSQRGPQSYEFYRRLHESGVLDDNPLLDEAEYSQRQQDQFSTIEAMLEPTIGGRESVVFLSPMAEYGTIAVQAWQVVAQWDLQLPANGVVEAAFYGTPNDDPESRQPLDELRNRIRVAASTDAFAGKRITSIDGLGDFYESIGAYGVIGPFNVPRSEREPFAPSEPPPARATSIVLDQILTRTPTPYAAPRFESISSGGNLTCGLDVDGTVTCWGGEHYDRTTPSSGGAIAQFSFVGVGHRPALRVSIPPSSQPFSHISTGKSHACGIMPDGIIGCWGEDRHGQSSPPHGSFSTISSGYDHSCAIRDDGAALCWGSEGSGRSSPPEGVELVEVSSGSEHTCALREDGTPVCWGYDSDGRSSPVTGSQLVSISAGGGHTCGLSADGSSLCWGSNNHGQSAPPPGERFTAISTGGWHTCALRPAGSVQCWGGNEGGQASPPVGDLFVSVDSGASHTCGLRQDGSALCWGDNETGKASPPGAEVYTQVDSGWMHSCALRPDGTPVCWGGDYYGYGVTDAPPGEKFVSLTVSAYHSCGLRSDGSVKCWGGDEYGQSSAPEIERFASISTGVGHTCGLRTNGEVTCWGRAEHGIEDAPSGEFSMIDSGGAHACGLRMDGSAECWGYDEDGQASPPDLSFVAVESGFTHSCGIRPDGSAVCWGSDENGSTSPPSGEYSSISIGSDKICGIRTDGEVICWGEGYTDDPSALPEDSFSSVSVGGNHVCGIRMDGLLLCWGDNGDGQSSPPGGLPHPDRYPNPIMTYALPLTPEPKSVRPQEFTSVASGDWHACALRVEDGGVECWGSDNYGQSSPPDEARLESISSGAFHTCGLQPSGTPVCWGAVDFDLGQAFPPGDVPLTSLSSGGTHTCGLRIDKTALCWGDDEYGQLGAPPDERFDQLSSGLVHTCGLRIDGSTVCWGAIGYDLGQADPPLEGHFTAISSGAVHTCGLRTDGTVACWGEDEDELEAGGLLSPPEGMVFSSISSGTRHTCGIAQDGSTVCWGPTSILTNIPKTSKFRPSAWDWGMSAVYPLMEPWCAGGRTSLEYRPHHLANPPGRLRSQLQSTRQPQLPV